MEAKGSDYVQLSSLELSGSWCACSNKECVHPPSRRQKRGCPYKAKHRHLLLFPHHVPLLRLAATCMWPHSVKGINVCSLSSGSTWQPRTERREWRPRSSGEYELQKKIKNTKVKIWHTGDWGPHPGLSALLVSESSSCVCAGSSWRPGACGTVWQSWQEGEWTQWPAPLGVCVCSHASVFVAVVCTCGQRSNTERLISSPTNNCLICA